jgi:hypothetical protein
MASFILTWREQVWPYEKLRMFIDDHRRNGSVERPWRLSSKDAKPGDGTFLFKQGAEPRGIFGYGTLLSTRFKESNVADDDGKFRWYAVVRFEMLKDPKCEPHLVSLTELRDALPSWPDRIFGSGQFPTSSVIEEWLNNRLRRSAKTIATS